MHTSCIIAAAIAVGLVASSVPALTTSAHAEGMVSEGKQTTKGTGKSVKEATDQLKTDTNKTKDGVKALDIENTKKGAGLVKDDAKDLQDSAKDMLTNPLGK
jgi:hypothetical protein